MLLFVERYAREDARSNPLTLFVFGDNIEQTGFGGQAKELRGEPNAVGIPTKWAPRKEDAAYFSDEDLPKVAHLIDGAFRRLHVHLEAGRDVVWPADGVGSGLAKLPDKAPKIYEYIQNKLDELCFETYTEDRVCVPGGGRNLLKRLQETLS